MYPPVNKHSNGKSPFSIGNTSSSGGFSIAMLDYRRVVGTFNIFSSTTDINKETQLYTSSSIFIPHQTYKKLGYLVAVSKNLNLPKFDIWSDTIGVTLEILGVQTVHLPSHCFHHPSPQWLVASYVNPKTCLDSRWMLSSCHVLWRKTG